MLVQGLITIISIIHFQAYGGGNDDDDEILYKRF